MAKPDPASLRAALVDIVSDVSPEFTEKRPYDYAVHIRARHDDTPLTLVLAGPVYDDAEDLAFRVTTRSWEPRRMVVEGSWAPRKEGLPHEFLVTRFACVERDRPIDPVGRAVPGAKTRFDALVEEQKALAIREATARMKAGLTGAVAAARAEAEAATTPTSEPPAFDFSKLSRPTMRTIGRPETVEAKDVVVLEGTVMPVPRHEIDGSAVYRFVPSKGPHAGAELSLVFEGNRASACDAGLGQALSRRLVAADDRAVAEGREAGRTELDREAALTLAVQGVFERQSDGSPSSRLVALSWYYQTAGRYPWVEGTVPEGVEDPFVEPRKRMDRVLSSIVRDALAPFAQAAGEAERAGRMPAELLDPFAFRTADGTLRNNEKGVATSTDPMMADLVSAITPFARAHRLAVASADYDREVKGHVSLGDFERARHAVDAYDVREETERLCVPRLSVDLERRGRREEELVAAARRESAHDRVRREASDAVLLEGRSARDAEL